GRAAGPLHVAGHRAGAVLEEGDPLVDAAGRGGDDHAPLAGDANAARVAVARGVVDHHAGRGEAPLAAEREAATIHVVNARLEGQVGGAANGAAARVHAGVKGDVGSRV